MTKLSSIYGRTVTLIAIVFLVSFAVLALAFTSISALTQRDKVRELERSILVANSSVRDFIITRDPFYAKRTEATLTRAGTLLKENIDSDEYVHLQSELHLYLYAIESLIEVYQDRGFYEDAGLEGRMRSKMAKLEGRLRDGAQTELLSQLLQVRRSEKNYLLRGRDEYQDGVHEGIATLISNLGNSTLSEAEKAYVSGAMLAYQTDFDGLVVLSQEVEWIKSELNNARIYLEESLSTILDKEEQRARTLLWVALGLIFLSFVSGILYSTYMAKSVVAPLEKIRRAANKLASGDLTEEFDIDHGNEIGDLARAFNEVAAQVRRRIQAEEELGQAKLKAEATASSKSAFLASMSHEIRTPLNGIIGMTSLIGADDLRPDHREMLDVIRTSSESLLDIVNDILDFSKIEANRIVLEEAPLNISETIEEALDMVSRQAAEKGLDISYAVDQDVPDNLLGDATRLRQILVNLLANAVKFTAGGEIHAKVSIQSIEADTAQIQFSVHDTGIGISEDKIATLFDAFQQADASTSRKYGGTGLGLSIARRLSELMNGRMWAESQVGVGSTFYFTVHLAQDHEADRLRPRANFASGRNVILMSRSRRFGRALCKMIESAGGNAHRVTSEEEALTLLRGADRYDLVLINDGPDGVDGLAGVVIARSLTELDCPIVLLRNLGDAVEDPRVANCLSKPVKVETLQTLFNSLRGPERPGRKVTPRPRAADRSAGKQNIKILLVEDNIINQKVALRMLQKLGYEAGVVSDGAAAVVEVAEGSPDIVFMDIQMPVMDGFEATRHIREHSDIDSQPFIVALTANATTEYRTKCLSSGMDDFLAKPFDMESLESILVRLTHASPKRESGNQSRSNPSYVS